MNKKHRFLCVTTDKGDELIELDKPITPASLMSTLDDLNKNAWLTNAWLTIVGKDDVYIYPISKILKLQLIKE